MSDDRPNNANVTSALLDAYLSLMQHITDLAASITDLGNRQLQHHRSLERLAGELQELRSLVAAPTPAPAAPAPAVPAPALAESQAFTSAAGTTTTTTWLGLPPTAVTAAAGVLFVVLLMRIFYQMMKGEEKDE